MLVAGSSDTGDVLRELASECGFEVDLIKKRNIVILLWFFFVSFGRWMKKIRL